MTVAVSEVEADEWSLPLKYNKFLSSIYWLRTTKRNERQTIRQDKRTIFSNQKGITCESSGVE